MTFFTEVGADEAPGFDVVLNELVTGHLDIHGGYPYDYAIEMDAVVIAELNDGDRAQLAWHDISMLKEWQSAWESRQDEDDSVWEYTPPAYLASN